MPAVVYKAPGGEGREPFRRADPHHRSLALRAVGRHAADPVHVAGHEVAPERRPQGERSFQVHRIAGAEAAEGGPGEGL